MLGVRDVWSLALGPMQNQKIFASNLEKNNWIQHKNGYVIWGFERLLLWKILWTPWYEGSVDWVSVIGPESQRAGSYCGPDLGQTDSKMGLVGLGRWEQSVIG